MVIFERILVVLITIGRTIFAVADYKCSKFVEKFFGEISKKPFTFPNICAIIVLQYKKEVLYGGK